MSSKEPLTELVDRFNHMSELGLRFVSEERNGVWFVELHLQGEEIYGVSHKISDTENKEIVEGFLCDMTLREVFYNGIIAKQ